MENSGFTSQPTVCANCGASLAEGQAFCASCGAPKPAPAPQPQPSFCANCGASLAEGQAFCPACGTPKAAPAPQPSVCAKCGAPLQPGQEFCASCGQRVGLMDAGMGTAINQFNAGVMQTNNQKKKLPWIIGGVVAAVVLLVVLVSGNSNKVDLEKLYDKYCNAYWADVASDGSFLSIDDNPNDTDDYYIEEADDAIQAINRELGFSSSLWNDMCSTSANDGKQTQSNDDVIVSWKYHPDRGLSVTYTLKD